MSPKKISLDHIDPRKRKVQDLIVSIHNYYRAKVDPPASNMLEVVRRVHIVAISEYLFFQRLREFRISRNLFCLELGRFCGLRCGSVVEGVPGAAARQRHREVGGRLRLVRTEHLHLHSARSLVSGNLCDFKRFGKSVEFSCFLPPFTTFCKLPCPLKGI